MPTLDVWGAVAASVLLVQCILFNVIFVALAVGLWYGTRWLRSHTKTAFVKVDDVAQKGQRYAIQGQSKVVQPFIGLRARVAQIRAMVQQLRGS